MYTSRDIQFEREEQAWSAADERRLNLPPDGVEIVTNHRGERFIEVTKGERVLIFNLANAKSYAKSMLAKVAEARYCEQAA